MCVHYNDSVMWFGQAMLVYFHSFWLVCKCSNIIKYSVSRSHFNAFFYLSLAQLEYCRWGYDNGSTWENGNGLLLLHRNSTVIGIKMCILFIRSNKKKYPPEFRVQFTVSVRSAHSNPRKSVSLPWNSKAAFATRPNVCSASSLKSSIFRLVVEAKKCICAFTLI